MLCETRPAQPNGSGRSILAASLVPSHRRSGPTLFAVSSYERQVDVRNVHLYAENTSSCPRGGQASVVEAAPLFLLRLALHNTCISSWRRAAAVLSVKPHSLRRALLRSAAAPTRRCCRIPVEFCVAYSLYYRYWCAPVIDTTGHWNGSPVIRIVHWFAGLPLDTTKSPPV
jgi:hypothetical protein